MGADARRSLPSGGRAGPTHSPWPAAPRRCRPRPGQPDDGRIPDRGRAHRPAPRSAALAAARQPPAGSTRQSGASARGRAAGAGQRAPPPAAGLRQPAHQRGAGSATEPGWLQQHLPERGAGRDRSAGQLAGRHHRTARGSRLLRPLGSLVRAGARHRRHRHRAAGGAGGAGPLPAGPRATVQAGVRPPPVPPAGWGRAALPYRRRTGHPNVAEDAPPPGAASEWRS